MSVVTHSELTIAASATRLFSHTSSPTVDGYTVTHNNIGEGGAIALVPLSTNTGTVYWGGSGVTTATGFPIPATGIAVDISNPNSIYLVGTANDKVRLIIVNARS